MKDQLITPKVLANRWTLKVTTLRHWRWSGKGPSFVKIGGRVMYRLCDIEKFEEGQVFTNTAQHTQKLATMIRTQAYA